MIPCVHAVILLKSLQVMYYEVHRLDFVQHDKFHPWKIYVAYEMFWGKSTVSDIISAIVLGMYAL